MFLQVKIPESDQIALKFLWWSEGNPAQLGEEYCMTVHPFGAVSSSFCASFALRKTANLYGHDYPSSITDAVQSGFYVDDLLLSVDDQIEARSTISSLTQLLGRAGFKLTKWASNQREVLTQIPSDERNVLVKELSDGTLPTEKALGLAWDMEGDSFIYQFEMKECPVTRRLLLSRLSAIYDPLG
ncbi:unnamed protein product [Echinostoma caproni]|uniref:Reverse transcriptase domain-containing protein n=1 Tax=Echinostoma caproni TaxID=27848 RepID=A0A183B4N0_9TREM|nr:unnamed protein product [Echinostoma caproni]